MGYKLDIRPGGKAVEKDILDPPVKGANNIGEQGGRVNAQGRPVNCGVFCLREGGGFSRALNRVPGINAVAGLHDVMQVNLGDGLAREILNFPWHGASRGHYLQRFCWPSSAAAEQSADHPSLGLQ